MRKLNLTEATIKALEGKLLNEEEQKGKKYTRRMNKLKDNAPLIYNLIKAAEEDNSVTVDFIKTYLTYLEYKNIKIELRYDLWDYEIRFGGIYNYIFNYIQKSKSLYPFEKIRKIIREIIEKYLKSYVHTATKIWELDSFTLKFRRGIPEENFDKRTDFLNKLKNLIDNLLVEMPKILEENKVEPILTKSYINQLTKSINKLLTKNNINEECKYEYAGKMDDPLSPWDEGPFIWCKIEIPKIGFIGISNCVSDKEPIHGFLVIDISTSDSKLDFGYRYAHTYPFNYHCNNTKDASKFIIDTLANKFIPYFISEQERIKQQKELNKTRLKYNIIYYLNTATRERREETRADVDNDYCNTVEYFDTDLEAFEYVMTDILDKDLEDFYENEKTDEEKIQSIIDYFEGQDYGDGEVIIVKVIGKKYKYDSGLTKKSFIAMANGSW